MGVITESWKGIETALPAGSAIALTEAVRMLALPHTETVGASLYIRQEYLIAGKPEWARSIAITRALDKGGKPPSFFIVV